MREGRAVAAVAVSFSRWRCRWTDAVVVAAVISCAAVAAAGKLAAAAAAAEAAAAQGKPMWRYVSACDCIRFLYKNVPERIDKHP